MKYFYYILIFGIVSGCIDPIDFDATEPERYLIVDGLVQSGGQQHLLHLSYSGALDKRVFDPVTQAQVNLITEDSLVLAYVEIGEGAYELNTGADAIRTGKQYFLDIQLPNGKHYQSKPEEAPPSIPIDSLSFELEATQIVNDFGNVLTRNFVRFSAHVTIPESNFDPYFRWSGISVYLVSEKVCGPLDNAQSCYIYPKDVLPNINILDGRDLVAGVPYQQDLTEVDIDYAFGERFSYSVFQYVHTAAAIDYWSKVEDVVALEGSIFDAAPAPIVGNVYNVDDPNELVLGYFAAASIDTAHIFLTSIDVQPIEPVSPFCGPPEQPFWLSPSECCSCLNLSNSTLTRPNFW